MNPSRFHYRTAVLVSTYLVLAVGPRAWSQGLTVTLKAGTSLKVKTDPCSVTLPSNTTVIVSGTSGQLAAGSGVQLSGGPIPAVLTHEISVALPGDAQVSYPSSLGPTISSDKTVKLPNDVVVFLPNGTTAQWTTTPITTVPISNQTITLPPNTAVRLPAGVEVTLPAESTFALGSTDHCGTSTFALGSTDHCPRCHASLAEGGVLCLPPSSGSWSGSGSCFQETWVAGPPVETIGPPDCYRGSVVLTSHARRLFGCCP